METTDNRLDIPSSAPSLAPLPQAGDAKNPPQRDPVFVLLDDLSADTDAVAAPPKSVAQSLAEMVLKAALPADIRRRIRQGKATAVVLQTPGPDWCTPLNNVIVEGRKGMRCVMRDGSAKLTKPTDGCAEIGAYLTAGDTVFGVSQNPSRFLPLTLVSVADAHVIIKAPNARILGELLRRYARGRVPKIPDGVAQGLSFSEIVSAFRAGATAREVVANLQSTSKRKSMASLSDDTPPLQDLPGYPEQAVRWGKKLADAVAEYKSERGSWPKDSGALLYGPPGTGKTLYARALAKSAGLSFVGTSVGSWFSGYSKGDLGDVAQAIRRSWDEAVAARPSLWFIDEISSLPDRSRLDADRLSWWAPVVDSVLELLTSPERDGVVVLGACNARPAALDAALTRVGRLGTHIEIPPPDAQALAEVLRFYLGGALADVDLSLVTQLSPGATPADAVGWADAALQAAKDQGREPAIDDLIAVVAPPDDRSAELLQIVAVHEAGHAVAYAHFGRRIASVSMIQRGALGGGVILVPNTMATLRLSDVETEVVGLLAGRAAEESFFGAVSSGAVADLEEATRQVAKAHAAHGLGGTLLHRGDPLKALLHDRQLREIVESDLQRLYAQALALMRERRGDVERLAHALIARRFLTGAEVEALLAAPPDNPQESP